MYSIINKPDAMIVDYRMPINMKKKIESYDIIIIDSIPHPKLSESVNGHPDLIACPINEITIIEPYFYEKKFRELENFNVKIGKDYIDLKYPDNIKYNVATIGNIALGLINNIDSCIFEELNLFNCNMINVNQGYSKCSSLILDEETLVTSDVSIYNSSNLKNSRIKIHLIEAGDIILSDIHYGFIGGASGLLDKKTIAFMGNLDYYIEGLKIKKLLNHLNIEPIYLSNSKLIDYGSLVPLYNK